MEEFNVMENEVTKVEDLTEITQEPEITEGNSNGSGIVAGVIGVGLLGGAVYLWTNRHKIKDAREAKKAARKAKKEEKYADYLAATGKWVVVKSDEVVKVVQVDSEEEETSDEE